MIYILDDFLVVILNYFQTCQLLTIRRVNRQFNKSANTVINARRVVMDINKCVKFDDCHYFKSNYLSLKVSKKMIRGFLTESYDRKHLCIPKLVLHNMTAGFGFHRVSQYLMNQIFLHDTIDGPILSKYIYGPQLSPEIVLEGFKNLVNHKNYNIKRTICIFNQWQIYWSNVNYTINPAILSYLVENNHLEIFKIRNNQFFGIQLTYRLLSYLPIPVQKFMGHRIAQSINWISDSIDTYFMPLIKFLNTAILFAAALSIIGKKMNN